MFRKKEFATAILVTLAATSLLSAGVERVTVRVDGLACPFCAYNIEKRMRTLEGVTKDSPFKMSVETGIAELAWSSTISFDPAAIRTQIRKAGFTPRDISITATGKVRVVLGASPRPERLELKDEDTRQTISILRDELPNRSESFYALGRYVRSSKDKQNSDRVRVIGEVIGEGTSWKLHLTRWEPMNYAATIVLGVSDLKCENCSYTVMHALSELEGVIHVEANHQDDTVWIWTDVMNPDEDAIREIVKTAGFEVIHAHTDTVVSDDED